MRGIKVPEHGCYQQRAERSFRGEVQDRYALHRQRLVRLAGGRFLPRMVELGDQIE